MMAAFLNIMLPNELRRRGVHEIKEDQEPAMMDNTTINMERNQ
jgi:hypothetical protein